MSRAGKLARHREKVAANCSGDNTPIKTSSAFTGKSPERREKYRTYKKHSTEKGRTRDIGATTGKKMLITGEKQNLESVTKYLRKRSQATIKRDDTGKVIISCPTFKNGI